MHTRWLLVLASLLSCSPDEVTPDLVTYRPECENINLTRCMMPWPSSRYLVADSTTATGRRVSIPANAMPGDKFGTLVSPEALNRADGFNAMPNFMTSFAGDIDTSNLASWQHVEQSVLDTSPTLLLDATTGERVAHFAEVDEHAAVPTAERPFYIRPAQRLKDNHHYVVAIRNLKTKDGVAIAPSAYFKALRDNETFPIAPDLEPRRASFEANVFAPLASNGVPRATLIEAWDMWTGSGESTWGDLIAMRDDMLTRLGAQGLGCSVKSVDEPNETESAEIFRQIEGTITVPLYEQENAPGSMLQRDTQGAPMANGMIEVPFTAIIPRSVAARIRDHRGPARIMQYGHGLFGDRGEVHSSYMRPFINQYEFVAVANDWWGMSEADVPFAVETLSNLSNWQRFIDRQKQGLVNFVALQRTIAGVCTNEEAFHIDGELAFDPGELYYHGNSQGGIFGMTLAAISVDVKRFGIGVGAIGYIVFMPRSTAWAQYELAMTGWYPHAMDRYLLLSMLAQIWDQVEPAGYADRILSNPLPNSPTGKHLLLQTGRYDALVANVGSDIAARTIGLPLQTPSIYDVHGLQTYTDFADDGYVIYDEGSEAIENDRAVYPSVNETVTHEAVRRDPRAQQQLDRFLRNDGRVENTCGGRCSAPTR